MALVADPSKDHHIGTGEHEDFFHGKHTNPRIQLEVGMGPSTVSYLQSNILWTNHPLAAQKEIIGIVTMEDVMKALLGRSFYPQRKRVERSLIAEKMRVDEEWKYAVDATTLKSDSFLPPTRFSKFSLEKSVSNATSRTAFSSTMMMGANGGGSSASTSSSVTVSGYSSRASTVRGGGGCTLIPLKELEVNLIEGRNSQMSLGCVWDDIQARSGSAALPEDFQGIAIIENTAIASAAHVQSNSPEIDAGVGTGIGIGIGMANVGVHHTGTLRRRFSFEGSLDEKEANLLDGGD